MQIQSNTAAGGIADSGMRGQRRMVLWACVALAVTSTATEILALGPAAPQGTTNTRLQPTSAAADRRRPSQRVATPLARSAAAPVEIH